MRSFPARTPPPEHEASKPLSVYMYPLHLEHVIARHQREALVDGGYVYRATERGRSGMEHAPGYGH